MTAKGDDLAFASRRHVRLSAAGHPLLPLNDPQVDDARQESANLKKASKTRSSNSSNNCITVKLTVAVIPAIHTGPITEHQQMDACSD